MSVTLKTGHGVALDRGSFPSKLVFCLIGLLFNIRLAFSISGKHLSDLRQDTSYLFYHGFDGYMKYAFPEDELRPVTCGAFTRDSGDQNNWELNDPLGNYSLTLIDSLSTLAILASSSQSGSDRQIALNKFQSGIQSVVELYGDGGSGSTGVGRRARGFDIDSKVQVFETAIRGLGGLLSAHLFAIGELPIQDYKPVNLDRSGISGQVRIKWNRKFHYDGQLLRLAHDLGRRLLPAFSTQTGVPYPRVNLRHGVPFYRNAPQNYEAEAPEDDFGYSSQCPATPQSNDERTETCSAGAGSLVLEFSALSRLTGDYRFEKLAKKAFWAVWDRRMPTGLVGAGIDAETGEWKGPPSTGIGAGVDSFYEYAIKSYVLLSGTAPLPNAKSNSTATLRFEPAPLTDSEDNADSFLDAWEKSQRAIRRHVYHGDNSVHPHYIQVNLFNAAQQATWIDSLSAFYSGSLVLAGEIEEAAVTHLLFTALWSRYSALPERWSTVTGDIEHGLPWWPGRPEFIESAYYLYQATQDPWYVHVGEMTLRDIKRRCWTPCGWAGLQDVRTGDLTDRMESFFLGETVKYLHLLFDPDHPLNKLDKPWVFSTEGHPLVIPSWAAKQNGRDTSSTAQQSHEFSPGMCPIPPKPLPFTVSNVAARLDLFHAAALARLDLSTHEVRPESALFGASKKRPSITLSDVVSPTNYTFYPWTLPRNLIPPTGICAPFAEVPTLHITFPTPSSLVINSPNHRSMDGIFMNNLAGVRLSMIQDLAMDGKSIAEGFRVNAINNQPIGRDEPIFVSRDTLSTVVIENDPYFSRVRDSVNLQIVFDLSKPTPTSSAQPQSQNVTSTQAGAKPAVEQLNPANTEQQDALIEALAKGANTAESALASALRFLAGKVSSKLASTGAPVAEPTFTRYYLPGIIASGLGAAPVPDVVDAPPLIAGSGQPRGDLLWKNIYGAGFLCEDTLPTDVVQRHEVLVIKRGGCTFSEKLENVPSYAPHGGSLQLVILVNDDNDGESASVKRRSPSRPYKFVPDKDSISFQPILDKQQRTPGGLVRRNPIPMVMVEGGDNVYNALVKARAFGLKRQYSIQAQGVPINNVHIL